jgi:hypothetical protein
MLQGSRNENVLVALFEKLIIEHGRSRWPGIGIHLKPKATVERAAPCVLAQALVNFR